MKAYPIISVSIAATCVCMYGACGCLRNSFPGTRKPVPPAYKQYMTTVVILESVARWVERKQDYEPASLTDSKTILEMYVKREHPINPNDKSDCNDVWGNPIHIDFLDGQPISIRSFGPDGVRSNSLGDDIVVVFGEEFVPKPPSP